MIGWLSKKAGRPLETKQGCHNYSKRFDSVGKKGVAK